MLIDASLDIDRLRCKVQISTIEIAAGQFVLPDLLLSECNIQNLFEIGRKDETITFLFCFLEINYVVICMMQKFLSSKFKISKEKLQNINQIKNRTPSVKELGATPTSIICCTNCKAREN